MNDYIYGLSPINKTAAVVTGQKGCSKELSAEQKRDSLVARIKQINHIFSTAKMKKSDPVKVKLTTELTSLCKEVSDLNKEMKKKPRHRDVSPFFLLVARDELTEFQYKRILSKAVELGNKYGWSTDEMKDDRRD